MINLFGEVVPDPLKSGKAGKPKTNPMIPLHGNGPDGVKCISCKHQFFREFANRYSKCSKRAPHKGKYDGASTDHNSRYQACGLYEPK